MITLCPTTWEQASKMANFSGWVRSKLKEEISQGKITARTAPEYWAYCKPCDLSATNGNKWLVEHKYCPKCHNPMEYMGMVE